MKIYIDGKLLKPDHAMYSMLNLQGDTALSMRAAWHVLDDLNPDTMKIVRVVHAGTIGGKPNEKSTDVEDVIKIAEQLKDAHHDYVVLTSKAFQLIKSAIG